MIRKSTPSSLSLTTTLTMNKLKEEKKIVKKIKTNLAFLINFF